MSNYRRHGRKVINGLAALALLLAGASGAKAADEKVFPGTMCVQQGISSTVYYDGNGRVLNSSTTQAVIVICPIVRDSVLDKWQSVKVVAADRNPNANLNVTCTARSNQTDGLGWSYDPTNPSDPFYATLNWWESKTFTFNPPTEERDRGTYFVSCTIPPRYVNGSSVYDSGIYSYRIDEP